MIEKQPSVSNISVEIVSIIIKLMKENEADKPGTEAAGLTSIGCILAEPEIFLSSLLTIPMLIMRVDGDFVNSKVQEIS